MWGLDSRKVTFGQCERDRSKETSTQKLGCVRSLEREGGNGNGKGDKHDQIHSHLGKEPTGFGEGRVRT